MLTVDHLTVIAPTLESGIAAFEKHAGVSATLGGKHSINGTEIALISLGERRYPELLCPDPDGPPEGSLGEQIAQVDAPVFVNYLVRCNDIDSTADQAETIGLKVDPDFTMSRNTPEGDHLEWRIGVFSGHPFGSIVPHLIDWMDSTHPATQCVDGCRFKSLQAITPDVSELTRIHDTLQIEVDVVAGDQHGLVAVLDTPRGELILRTNEPMA